MSELPKVFISYSHDSEEHKARVQRLADRLRQDGVACEIDQYEPFPPEGWPAWMRRQLDEADFVLVACTQTYFQRLTEDERPGVGLGARFEGGLIEQYLYEAKGQNQKFIPILFDSLDAEWIPKVLGRYSRFRVDTEEGYTTLLRYLTKQPAIVKPEVGPLKHLPPIPQENIAKRVKVLPSTIGSSLRRRWRWRAVVLLLLSGLVVAGGWWMSYQSSKLYKQGLQALATLNLLRARERFEEALYYTNRPVVRSALAETFMRLGNADRATQEAERALKRCERFFRCKDWLLVEARHVRINGNWSEVINRYKQLKEKDPREVEYPLGIAEAQIALGHCEEALETLEEMENPSEDPRLYLTKGKAASCLGDYKRQFEEASRVLKTAGKQRPNPLSAEGLLLRGIASYKTGKPAEALKDFQKALEYSPQNSPQDAQAHNSMAIVYYEQGNLKTAVDEFKRAHDSYHSHGDEFGAAEQVLAIANIYAHEGDLDGAQKEYKYAINLYEKSNLQLEKARVTGNLGDILLQRGDLAGAEKHLRDAIRIFGDAGYREEEAVHQCRLSQVHLENLDLKSAKDELTECLKSARETGSPSLEAKALLNQGNLLVCQGELESALYNYRRAREIYSGLGKQGETSRSELALAALQLERNMPEEARALIGPAKEYFHGQGALNEEAMAEVLLARTDLAEGKAQKALSSIEDIKQRVKDSKALALRVQASLVEARSLAAIRKIPEARQVIQRQLDDPQNRKDPKLRMETRLAQGELEVLHGDRNQGRELLSLVEEEARKRGFKLVETKAARLRAAS